jgi:hypothetical protein|uniref:Uncharacterized protein n=1 Tax=Picea glauca TaxID=3330 RepID=A0A101LYK9_PICGL|nr:hypothetical protein ABT39_MTgene5897 [Picea glauca]QHR92078.1 hypothetical protein Q903MT_gene6114 [Picea sitchensis]
MSLWPVLLPCLPELSLPLLLWDPPLLVLHLELVDLFRVMDLYAGKMRGSQNYILSQGGIIA